ncbi:retrovirus-related pol polyprotein from transposon TNT 1-94 [Tanacetum coccineum]
MFKAYDYVKSYLHKYVKQPGPKVVFRDDSTCITKGYGSINCDGVVFKKVAFVNGLKYNLVNIIQLCDAKYIVRFDVKRGTIFNSNKEIVMIAPRDKPCSSCEKGKHHRASFKTKQTSSIKKCLHLLHMDLFGPVTPRSINHEKYTLVIVDEYSSILVNFCDEKGILQNFSSPYTPEQNGVAERKNKTLIEAARTMLSRSVFSKQYLTEAIATACYTQNRVFNTRRQQTEETYHIIFDESTDTIKFIKPSDDNITIAESERYPPNEYLHSYEPSQRYQVNNNVVSFIDPYERPEPVVIETNLSSDQHDQNDHSA